MAKKSLIAKCSRRQEKAIKERAAGKKIVLPTRVYNRCKLCGKVRGYMRKFGTCRICFRELAREGRIAGVTKSSW
ncbi:MAG: type Z 30S ribosomal protein S14 [Candidatus Gracilibacteria bacterium]|jgi:small subunit ribosomal protein S14